MTIQERAREYLKMPYGRVVVPENEGGYYAQILEFPGCFSSGDTPEEAYRNLEEAAELWVESELEDGHAIPPPFIEEEYSGKFPLRMPKDLHRRAAILARRKGASLNQCIVAAVAVWAGATEAAQLMSGQLARTVINFNSEFAGGVASIERQTLSDIHAKGSYILKRAASPTSVQTMPTDYLKFANVE